MSVGGEFGGERGVPRGGFSVDKPWLRFLRSVTLVHLCCHNVWGCTGVLQKYLIHVAWYSCTCSPLTCPNTTSGAVARKSGSVLVLQPAVGEDGVKDGGGGGVELTG